MTHFSHPRSAEAPDAPAQDQPIRSNPALSLADGRDLDSLHSNLARAGGKLELGFIDEESLEKDESEKKENFRPQGGAQIEDAREMNRPADFQGIVNNGAPITPFPVTPATPIEWDVDPSPQLEGELRLSERKSGERAQQEAQTGLAVGDLEDLEAAKQTMMEVPPEEIVATIRALEAEPETNAETIEALKSSLDGTEFDERAVEDLDDATIELKSRKLRARIKDPSTQRKQAFFKELQELQAEAVRRQKAQKPVVLTDLSQEIPAAQDPFSTFSLNISDASFQLARSRDRKRRTPRSHLNQTRTILQRRRLR